VPPVVIASVAAGTTLAGGVVGAIERSNASDDAKDLMKQRLAEFERAGTPPNTALPLVLQEFKQQGILSPELEKQINIEASKVAQIQEDPKLRDAAMQGLQLLQQSSERGFGAEEEAAFAQARREAGKEAQGRLQSILQQAQARGMGRSGAELAAQLSASQAGDEALANQGLDIAAERARAQRDAINRMFGAATELREQDFGVARTKAEAKDLLNRFRVGMEADQQARNVAALRRAEELNLAEKQRIADVNIAMANQEQARQNEARLRDWQSKMDLARAKGGVYGDQAEQRLLEGISAAEGWAQVGQGVGSAITGLGEYGINKPKEIETTSQVGDITPMGPESIRDAEVLAEDSLGRTMNRDITTMGPESRQNIQTLPVDYLGRKKKPRGGFPSGGPTYV